MARKPNYRFERQERDRAKAAKKAAKAEEKRTKSDTDSGNADGGEDTAVLNRGLPHESD